MVADLISYAKAHPGALTYGSGGAGSPHQLFAEMFKTMTGIEMTHVPYKGSAPALTEVVGGHIALLFADPAPALPLIKAGKVRALGVTSAALLPAAPDIPPLAQSGVPGFDATGWGMVVRRRARRRRLSANCMTHSARYNRVRTFATVWHS
jgi:tripartite-type tricarboxylate transporter receptor subunit TctC